MRTVCLNPLSTLSCSPDLSVIVLRGSWACRLLPRFPPNMTRALWDMAASLEKASARSSTCCNLTPAIVRESVDIRLCPPAALTSEQSTAQAGGKMGLHFSD